MPENGLPAPASPASYRLILALSLAFMAHTLLLAGLPGPLQQPPATHHTLALRLATPASEPSKQSLPASEQSQPRHREFSVTDIPEPVTTTSESEPRPATRQERPQPVQEPEPATRSEPAQPAAAPPAPASSRSANSESRAGDSDTTEPVARITRSPAEQDPYLVKLASHLALQLEKQRVPAVSQLTESRNMELELTLLDNGALTRARVLKSTGIRKIDEAAYRAALAASPYPEPAGEDSDRFEVKLVFTPKQP